MDKKPFIPAECEVVVIEKTDVISTSLTSKRSLGEEEWEEYGFENLV